MEKNAQRRVRKNGDNTENLTPFSHHFFFSMTPLCKCQLGDSKKSIAHTYATIVGMPKNPSIHIGGRFFERSPPYHVATRWYSAAYVIFVGQFTGVCELEWPECGAFWSALPIFVDRWPRTPCTIDRDGKRSKKRRIRAILARKPRRPCPQKSHIPWKSI